MLRTSLASLMLLSCCFIADGARGAEEKYNWDLWGGIVVQEGGRMKPLDTLAWEFVVGVTGRGTFRPESFAPISSADVRDWPALGKAITGAKEGAAGRVASLLTPDLKERLGSVNLDDSELRSQIKNHESQLLSLQKEHADKAGEILVLDDLMETLRGSSAENDKLFDDYRKAQDSLKKVGQTKADLLHQLNEIIAMPNLYEEAAWSNVELTDEAKGLLKEKSTLTRPKLERLNHLLITAAYTEAIDSFSPGTTPYGTAQLEDRKYSATELYVRWLLTWQGWDGLKDWTQLPEARNDVAYWKFHKPDAWDVVPMIDARFTAIGPELKAETEKAVSARAVHANQPFDLWAQEVIQKLRQDADVSPEEEKVKDVFEAYMNLAHLRMGFNLSVGPNLSEDSQDWVPLLFVLVNNDRVNEAYDSALVERVRSGFHQAREGLLEENPTKFNQGSEVLAAALAELGKSSDLYPAQAEVAREIHYNKLQPFLWTAVIAIAATVILAISVGVSSRIPYVLGFAALLAAMGMMTYGMYLRIVISGRPPVTNMYETIIWSAFIAASIAITLGLIYGHRLIPTTAALLIGLSTLLAYNMPIDMGATISPLQPVLRSNYWLTVHVLTIVASYGAFMLAWGLGNVGLGYYILGKNRPEVIKPIALFAYRSIQVGFLLLAAGTILGGWWAADSWGRFWGWDPKETWALIALLGYAVILHARFAGLIGLFGLLAGAVIAFSGVVMAWYGVNFVLGAGLHAYAFGDGGRLYVLGATVLNLVYVGFACYRYGSGQNAVAPVRENQLKDSAYQKDIAEVTL